MDRSPAVPRHDGVPKGVLFGALALVGFAIVSTGFARVSDIGVSRMAPASEVAALSLRFEDRADGGVVIHDADRATEIAVLAPGGDGFIRATMRGFVRERKRADIGAEPPFRLVRWSNGSVSLEDPATGRRAELDAFGPDNAGAFARLFPTGDR